MEQGRPARLRLSRTACPLLLGEASGAGSGPAPASQPGQLQFRLTHQATHHAPGRCSFALPFARISGRAAGSDDGVASLLQALLPADEHSTQPAARRGHDDTWYEERCVFCACCKATVNSQAPKRGSRCHGCRRWLHTACSSAASAQQHVTAAVSADAGGSEASSRSGQQRSASQGLFFHSGDCREVYDHLAAAAAAGPQPLTVAGSGKAAPPSGEVWRLLDLREVRALWKDAQRRGTLLKQHERVQASLAADAAAASSSSSGGGRSDPLRTPRSRLEEFLLVSELLKSIGESPRDLLDDSFALLTREPGGGPGCAATFNLHGRDHARLQGLATSACRGRRGCATRLVRQLEGLLADAGVRQLVVIIEPHDAAAAGSGGARVDVERWLRRRMGFVSVGSEQHLAWRVELPEYHKNLTAGCTLLVKPLRVAGRPG